MSLPKTVTLVEVGARDGLQNESQIVSVQDKVNLIHALQAAGLKEIEVTSYVSPKWVPQMADNHQVMQAIERRPGVRWSVLTPNLKGLEAALADQPDEIVVFGSASETFSQRNINCSVAESVERFAPVVAKAHDLGIKVRAAISCALGCPYEGAIAPDQVETLVQRMKDIGVDHCGIADTIGVGTPAAVQAVMERALRHYPLHEVSGHFHDTWGQALANIYASLSMGIHRFDASVGGLGGCPYAKGATGNVATEDVLFMLQGLGIQTGVDFEAVVDAAAGIAQVLGRPVSSRAGRAALSRRQAQAKAAA